jgi:hypothetical protein
VYDNNNNDRYLKVSESVPLGTSESVPLGLVAQYFGSTRRLKRYKAVETLAIRRYKTNGRGITYTDLLTNRLASSKKQAQSSLKRCVAGGYLFILGDNRPQQYYPACLKSEISAKSVPVGVSGVGCFEHEKDLGEYSLEGYVLPLLAKAPLHIHKMQFKVQIPVECYHELVLPVGPSNRGKKHEEIIGRAQVRYCFYPNGSVMAFVQCSNAPFRLQYELDYSCLVAFFSQVRD